MFLRWLKSLFIATVLITLLAAGGLSYLIGEAVTLKTLVFILGLVAAVNYVAAGILDSSKLAGHHEPAPASKGLWSAAGVMTLAGLTTVYSVFAYWKEPPHPALQAAAQQRESAVPVKSVIRPASPAVIWVSYQREDERPKIPSSVAVPIVLAPAHTIKTIPAEKLEPFLKVMAAQDVWQVKESEVREVRTVSRELRVEQAPRRIIESVQPDPIPYSPMH
jgi:hypothetical protein